MDENESLKKTGLKVTLPRLKVLSIFENSKEKHLSAEDIYKEMIGSGDENWPCNNLSCFNSI